MTERIDLRLSTSRTTFINRCHEKDVLSSDGTGASIQPKPSVMTAPPVMMPIVAWEAFGGRLERGENLQVRSRVSGYFASTHFEEGQLVRRGGVIAVID